MIPARIVGCRRLPSSPQKTGVFAAASRSERMSASAGASGLAAYRLDGSDRFHVLDGQPTWLALAYGGRAYVGVSGEDPLTIVDLASGAVAGQRTRSLPTLLLGRGAGWWRQPITP